ncbi:MAG: GH3 auxin-responsive promoter family protein [Candidatus Moduliflexus flocculans]|nr:GH3 auxin-responsive promoter family protein [Candidatus Moduliflexus flocculans]
MRERTLASLAAAHDLEMISVWSPTFLLRLLDDLPDPGEIWPRLKLVSCWTAGASRGPAAELRARLPHAHLQPKGLMSTECVVTVPDACDRPVLNPQGFFEFERHGQVLLSDELEPGATYEVIATTASGLYRYRTGDLVRCAGHSDAEVPVLEFLGRTGVVSDLVGEKLVEVFVQEALAESPGWCFLTVQPGGAGYAVVTQAGVPVDLGAVEARLKRNPQYAHAVLLNQLSPLVHRPVDRLYDRFARVSTRRARAGRHQTRRLDSRSELDRLKGGCE